MKFMLASCIGLVSQRLHDLRRLQHSIEQLEGDVYLNVGSAVTGPEVSLKSLSMARNVTR